MAESEEKGHGANPSKTRRWIIPVILVITIIAGFIMGIPYYLYAIAHVKTDDAFIDAHITSLSSRVAGHIWKLYVNDNQMVTAGDLIIELDGRDFQTKVDQAQAALATAMSQSESDEINVSLTEIISYADLANANASVEYAEAALNTSSAKLAVAKSELAQAQANVEVAKSSLEQAQAEVQAMQALYDRDETDLKRNQQMYDTNSITRQELDHAIANAKVSGANLEAAKKQADVEQAKVTQAESAQQTARDNVSQQQSSYNEARSNVKEAGARLEAAKAAPQKVAYSKAQQKAAASQVQQAQAALNQAKLELSYVKIYAPVSGRVTHKTIAPGDYIVPGQTLMAIVPEDIYVIANYKETELTHMKPGQQVKISVDAFSGVTFRGYIDSIQAGSGAKFSLLPPENATGNYIKVVQRIPVKIAFDEPPDLDKYYIVPGMSVVPEVDISRQPRAPKVSAGQPSYTSWIAPYNSEDTNSAEIRNNVRSSEKSGN
jgi:membrane fusion protein (multidrug efflux system)